MQPPEGIARVAQCFQLILMDDGNPTNNLHTLCNIESNSLFSRLQWQRVKRLWIKVQNDSSCSSKFETALKGNGHQQLKP